MLNRLDVSMMIEIIEERVFDPHCAAINDLIHPECKGTGKYPFCWTDYLSIVDNSNELSFPHTPSFEVTPYYFELYRKLKEFKD